MRHRAKSFWQIVFVCFPVTPLSIVSYFFYEEHNTKNNKRNWVKVNFSKPLSFDARFGMYVIPINPCSGIHLHKLIKSHSLFSNAYSAEQVL